MGFLWLFHKSLKKATEFNISLHILMPSGFDETIECNTSKNKSDETRNLYVHGISFLWIYYYCPTEQRTALYPRRKKQCHQMASKVIKWHRYQIKSKKPCRTKIYDRAFHAAQIFSSDTITLYFLFQKP